MEIVTIVDVLVDQFYFYMYQPINPWLIERIIFWGSLSLHFHMVLNHLYPIKKAGNISEKDCGIFSKIYYFNIMVSYLYSFNHFIRINKIGKYLRNEYVSIPELMQCRKGKINSKDITERFLFSLFDSSIMTQIVERMCTVKLFYF